MASWLSSRTGRVLILGAGASFGHGCPEEIRPPISGLFFRTALEEPFASDYASLLAYLQKHLGISRGLLEAIDVEEVVGRLDPVWRMGLVPKDPYKIKEQFGTDFVWSSAPRMVKSLIVDVLWHSTTWFARRTCPFHDSLVGLWGQPGDQIISFNYDLIIDSSLSRTDRWHEATGYGWAVDLLGATNEDYAKSKVLLLKPHGSLNWSLRRLLLRNEEKWTVTIKPVADQLRKITEGGTPRYTPSASELWNRLLDLSDERKEHDWLRLAMARGDYYEEEPLGPYMVLPTPFKPLESMVRAELRLVWEAVARALRDSSEIFAVGFSFRDNHFNALLREQLLQEPKRRRLVWWDPGGRAKITEMRDLLQGTPTEIVLREATLADLVSAKGN